MRFGTKKEFTNHIQKFCNGIEMIGSGKLSRHLPADVDEYISQNLKMIESSKSLKKSVIFIVYYTRY